MKGGKWNEISQDGKNLIKRMLKFDYKQRDYARDLLKDIWFENAPSKELDIDLMRDVLENLKTFNATFKL